MDRTLCSGPYCNVPKRSGYMLITVFAAFKQFGRSRQKLHSAFPIRQRMIVVSFFAAPGADDRYVPAERTI